MGGPLEAAGKEGGERFAGGLTSVGGKAAKVGGVAIAAGFAAALTKGFGRLKAIDDARFKLEGLGHDAGTVDTIMTSALDSVKGTAFGLGDAATIAASAVAAGVEPGEDLTRTLSLTGDAASIAGVSLGEMGAIFGKVGAGNRMMTEEMNQLQDRGLPVLSWLQDEYGVTADKAREMVSSGEVDFATFQKIIEDNIGGAALKAGESFGGAFANMGAAVGRFGAAILGPAFSAAPNVFGAITGAVDRVTNAIGPLVERFSGPLAVGMGVVAGVITAVLVPAMIAWGVQSIIAAAKNAAAWTVAQLGAVKSAAVQGVAVVKTVAGWVLMGAQSLIHAAKMAAAWVVAMGPVGWVIAAVVGLVALIVANWDTVKEWTGKIWSWVSDKIKAVWEAVSRVVTTAVDAVVRFVKAGWDLIKNSTRAVWDWVQSKVKQVVGFLVNLFLNFTGPGLIIKHWDTIRDATRAVWDWISSKVSEVVGAVTGFVSNLVTRVVDYFTTMKDTLVRVATVIKDRVVEFFTGMRDGAVEVIGNLIADVRGIKDDVVGFFSGAGTWLLDAGKKMVQGLVDGIKSMAGAPKRVFDGIVGGIGNLLPGSPVKEGPLKVLNRGYAGGQIVKMLAGGMSSQAGQLAREADRLAMAALPGLTAGVPRVRPAVASVAGPAGARQGDLVQNFTGPVTEDVTGRAAALALRMA